MCYTYSPHCEIAPPSFAHFDAQGERLLGQSPKSTNRVADADTISMKTVWVNMESLMVGKCTGHLHRLQLGLLYSIRTE